MRLKKEKAVFFGLFYMLPVMLLAAILNPVFNHEGMHILFYLPSGNPMTLEALIYGLASAVMMVSVIVWFAGFTEIITSDKFIYLFGRIIPALSLVLSIALRFVPRYISKYKEIRESRKLAGEKGNIFTELSVMVTWALENSIDTADSMKARGYGQEKRTAYSIYTYGQRDRLLTFWLLFCTFVMFTSLSTDMFYFRFYPTVKYTGFTPLTVFGLFVFMALCLTPVIIDKLYDKD
ncbi:MAG: energy-coupling factor transporter transmembrane component T [Eubacteriales bacterium]|nr:energy-coupling factor transporter transmembrane component T [Eubacteriales bacterium]